MEFGKEPYFPRALMQKIPDSLGSLQIVAIPYFDDHLNFAPAASCEIDGDFTEDNHHAGLREFDTLYA